MTTLNNISTILDIPLEVTSYYALHHLPYIGITSFTILQSPCMEVKEPNSQITKGTNLTQVQNTGVLVTVLVSLQLQSPS